MTFGVDNERRGWKNRVHEPIVIYEVIKNNFFFKIVSRGKPTCVSCKRKQFAQFFEISLATVKSEQFLSLNYFLTAINANQL